MTISSTSRRTAILSGNGATVAFTFSFKVQDTDDVVVHREVDGEEDIVATSEYSVSLNSNQNTSPGGTVTFDTAPPSGTTLRITTDADSTQEQSIQNQSSFNPTIVAEALDKLTILVQQQEDKISRAILASIMDPVQSSLGPSDGTAKYIIQDSNGAFTTADAPTSTTGLAAGWAVILGATPAPVRYVATIAALKALTKANLTTGEQRLVRYYGPREGYGGGRFRWDAASSATADNVVTFATDEGGTGRWIRMLDTPLCPTMAGVAFDSDGTAGNGTDDTAAWRVFGAYLQTVKGGAIRHTVPAGSFTRMYPTASDTSKIFNISNCTGLEWDWNGTAAYADRDVRAEGSVIYPFQFTGTTSRDVKVYGGKLTGRSRTIAQNVDLTGMRWFYFGGKGDGLVWDMAVEYAIEGIFVQRVAGTDAAATRWSNLIVRSRAFQCTYGAGLADSGDNALVSIRANGCFRSIIAYGLNGLSGLVRSVNHAGGDLRLTAWKNGAGITEDRPLKNVDLVYVGDPFDHSEAAFNPGDAIAIECRGTGGATMEKVQVRAFLLSNSSLPYRVCAKWYKATDDGAAVDTTGSRGHVVRNCSLSLTAINIDASSINAAAELFHSTNCGNWTGETIDNFRLHDTRTTGSKSDIWFGLAGHVNGPVIENVTTDEDFTFSGSAPSTMRITGLRSDNINIGFSIGDIANRNGGVYFPSLGVTMQTPANASATGIKDTICWDTDYIYVCTATNTWKRAAIATW